MGHVTSKIPNPLHGCSGSVAEIITGRKRKRIEDHDSSNDEDVKALEKSLSTPKKKKLLTTTQYIYNALFKEQKNSDITVLTLGKTWYLHKVYLCQSPYFFSMFNGSWEESKKDFIHIRIMDDTITLEALEAVFGSLYSDEIDIEPTKVVSILATATLFQLEGIIDKCAEVMIETTNAETAINYYETACIYGVRVVKQAAFEWLETNLVGYYFKYCKYLKKINDELITALIASPNLYVFQTEFSLYILLRLWMYLHFFPEYDQDSDYCKLQGNNPQTFFAERDDKTPFLLTVGGSKYIKPFSALRVQHLLNHNIDLKLVIQDNIIPLEWLNPHIMSHWSSVLKIDHNPEEGPKDVAEDIFLQTSVRCGRILKDASHQKWRWTGFNFGLDLILIADSGVLSIKRHHRNEYERLLSLKSKRQFMIRVTITSLNEQNQRSFTQTTGIQSLELEKNEEVNLMIMNSKLVHPLLISVNLLINPPNQQKGITEKSVEEKSISNIGQNILNTSIPTTDSINSSRNEIPNENFYD